MKIFDDKPVTAAMIIFIWYIGSIILAAAYTPFILLLVGPIVGSLLFLLIRELWREWH